MIHWVDLHPLHLLLPPSLGAKGMLDALYALVAPVHPVYLVTLGALVALVHPVRLVQPSVLGVLRAPVHPVYQN